MFDKCTFDICSEDHRSPPPERPSHLYPNTSHLHESSHINSLHQAYNLI